jgi:hypothetical protein
MQVKAKQNIRTFENAKKHNFLDGFAFIGTLKNPKSNVRLIDCNIGENIVVENEKQAIAVKERAPAYHPVALVAQLYIAGGLVAI